MDEDTVKEVSDNARIELDEQEREAFAEDLEEVIEAFSSVQEVDTEDVEPAFHPVDIEESSREDETKSCLDRQEALANSDNTEDGFFKGPSI